MGLAKALRTPAAVVANVDDFYRRPCPTNVPAQCRLCGGAFETTEDWNGSILLKNSV
jgi:hypothetical protein